MTKNNMNIYQSIWDADMSGNGVQPIIYGERGDSAMGFVVVNEKNTRNKGHKLFPKVVIPKHKKETYTLCKLLLDNYRLDKTKNEHISFAEEQEVHEFLEAIVDTKPMKVVRRYLAQKSGQTYSSNRWYNILKQIYFTPFSMSGSSSLTGFEHIVVGEQKQGAVSGYHFWYKYYLDDSSSYLMSDDIDYLGTRSDKDDLVVPETSTITFKWDAYDHDKSVNRPLYKAAGGFFNGCSIEGLLAIGTLRFTKYGPEEAIINGAKYNLKMHSHYRQMITYYPEFIEIVDKNVIGNVIKTKPKIEPKIVEKGTQPKEHISVIKVPEMSVRILAALVNPKGTDKGHETITLLNTTPKAVNLKGWAIEDIKGRRTIIDMVIYAGNTAIIELKGGTTNLINTGGTLILFDHENDPIDLVSYSRNDASNEGWTIVF